MSIDLIKTTSECFSFANIDRYQSVNVTHIYHNYPMRFIPQLARSLIAMYSREGDVIVDPFMGSGTTLVEAFLLGRKSWGLDINPVAEMIARAKTAPLPPCDLKKAIDEFCRCFVHCPPEPLIPENKVQRILWWFPEENVKRLGVLNRLISNLPTDLWAFFTCAFSNILKQCSHWSPNSIKPIRSTKRHRVKIADPFVAMQHQLKAMEVGNKELWDLTRGLSVETKIFRGDARRLPANDSSVDLIVTSPPYVTAYDYTEIFQLSILWLEQDADKLRRQIIGTKVIGKKASLPKMPSEASWKKTIEEVYRHNHGSGVAAARYYQSMDAALLEMVRVLRPGGHIALVAGNSFLRGVSLPNTIIFGKVLESEGLQPVASVERPINGRSLPPVRDAKTGRFLKTPREGSVVAYRTETVMVYQKPGRGVSDDRIN